MNSTEQRERFTAVSRVEKRLDDVEIVLAGLVEALKTERDQRMRADDQERTHRLDLAREQRAYVDDSDHRLRASFAEFRWSPVWARWRWLLGRG